jgi:hypothetical protein
VKRQNLSGKAVYNMGIDSIGHNAFVLYDTQQLFGLRLAVYLILLGTNALTFVCFIH